MQFADMQCTISFASIERFRNAAITPLLISLATLLAVSLSTSTAAAAPLKVLHSFCPSGANGCSDGQSPTSRLVADPAGNFYGTTELGGANGTSTSGGTVFELVPNAAKTRWQEKVLYSFCAAANCADGSEPKTGLVIGNDGHLYGTTVSGGANNLGTVFELIPNADKTRWRERVLYSFCSAASCADGELPLAELIMDQAGDLYGTAEQGGGPNSAGIVFELVPNASKTRWHERVIYSFCPTPDANVCPDGAYPQAALLMDGSGNLYSTTGGGGATGGGTVFELLPNAAKTRWREKVLYSFCSAAECVDGKKPTAALITDAAGDLFGTTQNAAGSGSTGTVFELMPNAARTRWHEKVLYTFCSLASCADGQQPVASLAMGGAGLLYGTTQFGGSGGVGTVFALAPNAAKTRWRERVLHSFCNTSCGGSQPQAGLIMDQAGNLYGTTIAGPTFGAGTVFEVKLN